MVMSAGFHKEPKKKQKKGDDDDEMEDAAGREARWGRVALAATKQSLRCVAVSQIREQLDVKPTKLLSAGTLLQ